MIQVAVLGCGTVGSGVIKLLNQNQDLISHRSGCPIVLKKVLEKDRQKCLEAGLSPEMIAQDYDEILGDDEIDIIIELIGGMEPAFQFIMSAMERGKQVVTANKDLIAVRGKELFEMAASHNVDFYFEASVAGGIPIVYALKQSLAGNNIKALIGILNGTTNYILTKMSREGRDFSEVLQEAQALGYAESDPSSDVQGTDAARKIAILSSIAFNSRVTLDNVYVEGITSITPEDIKYAHELGYVIKLLAIAKEEVPGQIQIRVHPAFLPSSHPLASVNDVFNAVFIQGDAVGDIMHYGRGAGQMPTASAVVGDIIEISRNIAQHITARIGCTCYQEKKILDISQLKSQYYIRMLANDRPGVLAGIAGVFGSNNVSIATVIQKSSRGEQADLILITHKTMEGDLRDALTILRGMSIVHKISNVIRVEENGQEGL
ncbi:MAG TPA: homoserine dehydrogenase [Syntrophomonadaceae bacterium]|nr:homoserine dehydrogenase [Syntrophomonadaceae bacterium]